MRKTLLFRRVAAFFAVVALLGHGLAMLLGAALMPTSKAEAAGLPDFIEICTPRGIVLQPFNQAADSAGETPEPDSGHRDWEDCPICTAFGQLSLGMPGDLAVIGRDGAPLQPAVRPAALAQGLDVALPQSRAPPRLH